MIIYKQVNKIKIVLNKTSLIKSNANPIELFKYM